MTQTTDEISRALGRIEANTENLNSLVSKLFEKHDKTQRELHETLGIAKEALRLANEHTVSLRLVQIRQNEIKDEIEQQIKTEVQPVLDDYKKTKQYGLGGIAVLSIVSSIVGGVIVHLKPWTKWIT